MRNFVKRRSNQRAIEIGVIVFFVGLVLVPLAFRAKEIQMGDAALAENVVRDPLFFSISGRWAFDFEASLRELQSAGATEELVSRTRRFYSENPELGGMHPDMIIDGNVAVCSGEPNAEYRFFSMHRHGHQLCGKALFHEDRFDPGDMSKCYVRMSIHDDELRLEVRMQQQSYPDLDDPDLLSFKVVAPEAARRCEADNPSNGSWSDWTMYVFRRKN